MRSEQRKWYYFHWIGSANEIYVGGAFDNWSMTKKLSKVPNGFGAWVELPEAQPYLYEYQVNGKRGIDINNRTSEGPRGNTYNVVDIDKCQERAPHFRPQGSGPVIYHLPYVNSAPRSGEDHSENSKRAGVANIGPPSEAAVRYRAQNPAASIAGSSTNPMSRDARNALCNDCVSLHAQQFPNETRGGKVVSKIFVASFHQRNPYVPLWCERHQCPFKDDYDGLCPTRKSKLHSHCSEHVALLGEDAAQAGKLSPVPPSYPYEALDFNTHEIRLLILKSNSLDSKIVCDMKHESLIEPSPYIALSYCWGKANSGWQHIEIGSYSMQISENLYEALKTIREFRRRSGHAETKLWVDALCINQENFQERSEQVRNMRQIYSLAREVMAFVAPGTCSPATSRALESFQKWEHEIETEWQGENEQNKQLGLLATEEWTILRDMFSEPYWRRVWIIQELTVASNVTVLYKGFQMGWTNVAAILSTIKKCSTSMNIPHSGTYMDITHLLEFRENFLVKRNPISLIDAMQWSCKSLATDPRDKIFALLGMCHDGPTFVPVPNYHQSLETILISMSREMIRLNRCADIACLKGFAPHVEKTYSLPSWVPDWPLIWDGRMTIQETKIKGSQHQNRSSTIIVADKVMKLMGVKLGTITSLSPRMAHRDEAWCPVEDRGVYEDSDLPIYIDSQPLEQLRRRDKIWKSLTMFGSVLGSNIDEQDASKCFATLWTSKGRGKLKSIRLIEWVDKATNLRIGKLTLREWSLLHGPPGQRPPPNRLNAKRGLDFGSFVDVLEQVLGSGMRLASWGSEAFGTAMVHPSTAEGDQVYMLRGCTIPLVLRPVVSPGNNLYNIIGGAYIPDTGSEQMEEIKKWHSGNSSFIEKGSKAVSYGREVILR